MSKLKNALRSFNDEDEEELDIETDWSRLEEDEDMDDYSGMVASFDGKGEFKGMSNPNMDMEFGEEYEDDDSDWQELDLDDESRLEPT